ncbi:hypothetical protein EHS39_23670 [Ensifer sp. MPMI2T]|nr:hypothetical protein EHS39_23670 [Ensifer sp. MPMI2T]
MGLGWNWLLTWGSLLTGVLSAFFWACSATITITSKPMTERKLNDRLDEVIEPLRRQSALNGWGAALAALTVALQAAKQFLFG